MQDGPPTPKPGVETTEFWATIFTQVLAVIAVFHPGVKVQQYTPLVGVAATLAAAVATGLYALSRARVKAAQAQVTAMWVRDLGSVESEVADLSAQLSALTASLQASSSAVPAATP